MKTYIGIGHDPEQPGPARIYVQTPGQEMQPLQHRERHSPTGMTWGYGGSGPADTARSILWDILDHEPRPGLYQAFKRQYVATWPMHPGQCWRITDEELTHWLIAHEEQRDSQAEDFPG